MIDAAFQQQVDGCLAALEQQQPALQRLRRVPMDLIAETVLRELAPFQLSGVRVIAWKDAAVQRTLLVIAARNGSIIRAAIAAPSVLDS